MTCFVYFSEATWFPLFDKSKILFCSTVLIIWEKIVISPTPQFPAENNVYIFFFYKVILLVEKYCLLAAFCREEKFQNEIKTN